MTILHCYIAYEQVLGRLWLLVSHGVLEDPEMHLVLPKPFLGSY